MNGKQLVVVVLCACAYFFCILNRTCLAVMFDELASTFNCPVHEIGFCGGSFFLACAVSQPLAQAITLKFDVGILLGLSMLVATIGSLGFAFSRSLAVACVTRALTGLGVGPVSLLLGELMRGWFPRRTFVAVSGIMMYAGSLGAMVAQGPLSSFLYKFDWQIAFYVVSGCSGVLGILLLLLARGYTVKINLEGSNFGVLGDSLLVEEVKTSPFSTSFVGTRQFWTLMGYFACVPSVFLNFACFWIGPYLADYFAYTGIEAGYLQVVGTLGAMMGMILMGMLIEKVGRKAVMVIGVVLTLIVMIGMFFVSRPVNNVAIVFCVFFFAFGALGPVPGAVSLLRDMDSSVLLAGYADMFTYLLTGLLQMLGAGVMKGMCKNCDDFAKKELLAAFWIPSLLLVLLGVVFSVSVRATSVDDDDGFDRFEGMAY